MAPREELPDLGPSCFPLLCIAKGGMGAVYLGLHRDAADVWSAVAVKVLHGFIQGREAYEMFADEAHIGMKVHHPNVVRVLASEATQGVPFLVMEYVEGLSWARILRRFAKRGETVPIRIAARVIHDALRGLAAVHAMENPDRSNAGIVHRDVSPQNILVGSDGRARIADFGVATYRGRALETKPGEVRGKFSYLSPEQIAREPIDGRADVFAAAIVFWEALAGRSLFLADSHVETLMKVLHEPIAPPSSLREGISNELEDACLRALERDPARRFADANEFADAIAAATELASDEEVGALVCDVARSDIARHRAALAAVEEAALTRVVEEAPTVLAAAEHEATVTDTVRRTHARRSTRRHWGVAAVSAMLTVSVGLFAQPSARPAHAAPAVAPAPRPVVAEAPPPPPPPPLPLPITVPTVRIVRRTVVPVRAMTRTVAREYVPSQL